MTISHSQPSGSYPQSFYPPNGFASQPTQPHTYTTNGGLPQSTSTPGQISAYPRPSSSIRPSPMMQQSTSQQNGAAYAGAGWIKYGNWYGTGGDPSPKASGSNVTLGGNVKKPTLGAYDTFASPAIALDTGDRFTELLQQKLGLDEQHQPASYAPQILDNGMGSYSSYPQPQQPILQHGVHHQLERTPLTLPPNHNSITPSKPLDISHQHQQQPQDPQAFASPYAQHIPQPALAFPQATNYKNVEFDPLAIERVLHDYSQTHIQPDLVAPVAPMFYGWELAPNTTAYTSTFIPDAQAVTSDVMANPGSTYETSAPVSVSGQASYPITYSNENMYTGLPSTSLQPTSYSLQPSPQLLSTRSSPMSQGQLPNSTPLSQPAALPVPSWQMPSYYSGNLMNSGTQLASTQTMGPVQISGTAMAHSALHFNPDPSSGHATAAMPMSVQTALQLPQTVQNPASTSTGMSAKLTMSASVQSGINQSSSSSMSSSVVDGGVTPGPGPGQARLGSWASSEKLFGMTRPSSHTTPMNKHGLSSSSARKPTWAVAPSSSTELTSSSLPPPPRAISSAHSSPPVHTLSPNAFKALPTPTTLPPAPARRRVSHSPILSNASSVSSAATDNPSKRTVSGYSVDSFVSDDLLGASRVGKKQKIGSISPSSSGAAILDPASASADEKDEKKVIIACHTCRARKLKCDGAKPRCHHCSRRKEDVCEYDVRLRRRGPGKQNKGKGSKKAAQAQALALAQGQAQATTKDERGPWSGGEEMSVTGSGSGSGSASGPGSPQLGMSIDRD